MPDPLDPGTAKRRIRQILTGGRVAFGTHAKQEMGKDRLDAVDVTNVLRCGAVNVNQYVGNDWRYTIETGRICVVFLFRGSDEIRVITVWRK